ncbi:MAG: 4-hydroxy-tetrahydrodipicolinate synthase [Bacteriovoracaceae bacterium]|nr:4-hydroxy-tetrahydrodipicolinate synthase [Bacteriovoracaceae bacterium]
MKLDNYPLWTALVTPLNTNQTVDYPSLKKLVLMQEKAKNGILILGSTGEALNLSLDERKEILKSVLELKPSVPIMVGVGGINMAETIEWVEYLNSLSVDCYLLVTPLYAKPGKMGQYFWFKSLLDASNRPCMLYNIPSRSGIELNVESYKMLKGHENLWALKEASGSIPNFLEYVQANNDVLVFSGDDAMMPAFIKLGAKGLVSVASNVWPKATHKYVKRGLEGLLNDNEIKLWEVASNSLFVASNPIPVKALLKEHGVIKEKTMRLPLCDDDLNDLSILVEQSGNVENWNKSIQ